MFKGFALLAFILAYQCVQGAVFTSSLITNLPSLGEGASSSFLSNGVAMGASFYFAAGDGPNGATGMELWRTDGTTGGTTQVRDIRPGAGGSMPSGLTVVGTNLFFVADDGQHGRQLWKSDGTSNGTVRVTDFPGTPPANYNWTLKAATNALYFLAPVLVPSLHLALYKTDGSVAGTIKLSGDSGVATTNQSSSSFETFGGEVIFATVDGPSANSLWRSDGTGGGSSRLEVTTNTVGDIRILSPNCYFAGSNTVVGLFRRPLTAGGTATLVDSGPTNGTYYTAIKLLGVVNSRLVYNGDHLFCICFPFLGCACATLSELYSVGNAAARQSLGSYFAYAGQNGSLLYYLYSPQGLAQTDGTSGGTAQVVDFSSLGITPDLFFAWVGSRFLFAGSSTAAGREIGATDFTQAGTYLIDSIRPGAVGSQALLLGALGTNAFFGANDGTNGMELWRSGGTTNSTLLVKDIAPGTDSAPPTEAVAAGTNVFFTVDAPGVGRELWKSDGTVAGTGLLKDIRAGSISSGPTNLTALNGAVCFFANDGTNGTELWRSDGTPGGTALLKDCRFGVNSSNPSNMVAATSQVFFVADNGAHGPELWRSDGTFNGTYMVLDINPGLGSGQIGNLSTVGNLAYFVAFSPSTGRELWYSDGSLGGAQLIKDLNAGTNNSSPSNFVGYAGAVYFQTVNSVTFGGNTFTFYSLWRTDGSSDGTVTVTNIDGLSQIYAAGTNLFLVGSNTLWKSDGTAGGTAPLIQFGLPPKRLTGLGENLYFTVGEDLWTSDGTTNGTVLVADFPAPPNSTHGTDNLTPFLGAMVFGANTPPFGYEPWNFAPGQTPTMIEDLVPGSADADARLFSPATDRLFYFARPNGQPGWQVRALQLQSLNPPPRAPWNGVPVSIPGRIEAEQFDIGGEGVAYHDATVVNDGGQFRVGEAVDIEAANDVDGAFAVSRTQTGEWLEYTFQTALPGAYRLDLRVSSAIAGGNFHAGLDGFTVGGTMTVPNTASAWTTLSIPNFMVNAGTHVLRLTFDSTNAVGTAGNVNWLEYVFTASNQPPTVTITAPAQETIVPTGVSVRLSATITDTTTATQPSAEFFIDGQSVGTDLSSPYQNNWLATAGAHVLRVRATDSFGATRTSVGRLFFVADPVIATGAEWLYMDAGANLGTTWRGVAYNDRDWSSGLAELGFGDGDEATQLAKTNASTPIITYYFRQHFMVTNTAPLNHTLVTLTRDDGGVVYLNGQEVGRVNLPAAPANILYTTTALTNINNVALIQEEANDNFVVPVGVLSNGPNVIAVEIHQASVAPVAQFDLSFDLSLSTFAYNPGAVLTITLANKNVQVRWPDYLGTWQLEQSTNLATWTDVADSPKFSGEFAVIDVPVLPSQMFFRLRQAP